MASGTKIRTLSRLLDGSGAPLWVIDSHGRLAYLSAACQAWLGVDIDSLIGRQAIAGAAVSSEPLDQIAASLSPPPGLRERGTASMRVQPPGTANHRAAPVEVRFVRVGQGEQAWTLGISGEFDDRTVNPPLLDAVALRQRLDAWRKQHAGIATVATAGESPSARRLRRRLQVAGSIRCDQGFFGPPGCGSESIAARAHHLSAPDEPLLAVDGPLMDAELLDVTLQPLVHQLSESSDSRATAIVRGLDEMPMDAQQRLATLLGTFAPRLRLLALASTRPAVLTDAADSPRNDVAIGDVADEPARGIIADLIESLSAMTIEIQPLACRVEDIPLMATALLDARHAAGQSTAERLSRGALDALVIYPWPRNLEELEEAIRHAGTSATSPSIGVENLPLAIRSYRPGEKPAASKLDAGSLDDAVQRYEMQLINETVNATGGNRAEAARRLGISRARLLRKLEERSKPDAQHGEGI